MRFLVVLLVLFLSSASFASNDKVITMKQFKGFSSLSALDIDTTKNRNINKIKIIAVTLAVTLGVFGVHRLYLGTKSLVPISYTLTLGGGMAILPIIDIIYIISAKDINQITNNDYIFMWNKKLATSRF
ncbi:MAG: TM2 domain-containing membrane protein YozV [Urechidicola sp.]|jgi:TM2 domain-containing membrane protein YozV|tara:strand:+ start:263 stop:649 length:387 start_codon:yes stop_codon:yes gene_type:complete